MRKVKLFKYFINITYSTIVDQFGKLIIVKVTNITFNKLPEELFLCFIYIIVYYLLFYSGINNNL